MLAADPLKVLVDVTVRLPALALEKVPLTLIVILPTSPATTPFNTAVPVKVAVAVPSYVFGFAVNPVTVKAFAVIFLDVNVGCVTV